MKKRDAGYNKDTYGARIPHGKISENCSGVAGAFQGDAANRLVGMRVSMPEMY